MKIQLNSFYRFSQRKNVLFAFVFIFFSFFLFSIQQAQAGCDPSVWGFISNTVTGDCGARESWGAGASSAADSLLKPIAVKLLSVEAALANAAAGLFTYILNPDSFSKLMNNGVFYEVWKIVRDTMNMLFILVLLFSAFATIYQIDKYKYNKILWMVIIMALLVNFSWPISRVIVDFFNSMMYFFVQSVFQTNGQAVASGILGGADLSAIFLPAQANSDWDQILLAIIVMFIFMATLLTLSLMMLVRLVALPILVMFSPVGFAGMAAPLTQGYAKKWWDKLFQYASYGPIAVFMVLVSVRVLQKIGDWKTGMTATMQGMSANTGSMQPDQLATLAAFAIPIILFWMAITSAEKMSGEMGYAAGNFGSRLVKWGGRQPWRGAKAGSSAAWRWTGIPGGVGQAWKNRRMFFGSDSTRAREAREARLAGLIGGGEAGRKNASYEAFNKRVAAEQEALKKFGNVSKAQTMLNNGNKEQKKAAALYLAEHEALTGATDFQNALKAVGTDLSAARNIISKAPKSVLASATDLSASLKILGNNGHQKLYGEAIAKAEKKALGNTGAEYNNILEQLADKDSTGKAMVDATTGEFIVNEDLKKTYDKRLVEQGQVHIRVESSVDKLKSTATGPLTPAQITKAYGDVFNRVSANDLTKQNEGMLTSGEFKEYFKSKEARSQREIKAAMGRENKDDILTALA